MNSKKNLYVGIGVGVAACAGAALIMKPKKRRIKSAVGKALLSMSELADSVSDSIRW